MSARARVWIIVGLAAAAAAGIVVGVTLATRNDVQRQSSKPPPFRHGSPAADPRRALPTQRSRPTRARPCARTVGPAGRRDPGVAGGRACPAGLALGRQSPGPPAPRDPARPAALRAELHARDGCGRVAAAAGRGLPAGSSAGLCRTRVCRGGEGCPERPRGADGGGRRPVRQGPARPFVLAPRPARAPPCSNRAVPPRASADLLRRHASCPSRIGPCPSARPTDTAWKEGRDASEGRSKPVGPSGTKDEPFGLWRPSDTTGTVRHR